VSVNQISNQEPNNEIKGDSDGNAEKEPDEYLTFDYGSLEREIRKERKLEVRLNLNIIYIYIFFCYISLLFLYLVDSRYDECNVKI